MSLFSGTKVEMVQDGEFVRHVHVTVFRNRNGNGLLFDSECPGVLLLLPRWSICNSAVTRGAGSLPFSLTRRAAAA